jgi:hypothetical protein
MRTNECQSDQDQLVAERKKRRQHIKAAIAFTCASTILALFFALVISSHPERGTLLNGMLISLLIGSFLGYLPFWAERRRAARNSLLFPVLLCGSIASGLMVLFYYLLHTFYREGVFHGTLAAGAVAGAFFAAAYVYFVQSDDSRINKT